MSGYIFGVVEVTDPNSMAEYQKHVGATVEQYGGRFAAAGTVVDVLEGDLKPHLAIALEFDTADDARRWYDSPEYGEVRPIRLRCAHGTAVLVEGV